MQHPIPNFSINLFTLFLLFNYNLAYLFVKVDTFFCFKSCLVCFFFFLSIELFCFHFIDVNQRMRQDFESRSLFACHGIILTLMLDDTKVIFQIV
ncbi:hypothetical protein Lalb_Chr24g0402581 [Lupinus albus]|uniref:Uncharacterized protein n=1 Tax=Lupinus albus TaxID=3870 RepID=A0A6A4NG70_LUPAL|nr:hypothetical protein Lalb_Chr24g0402581 [Lupinus albus]